MRREGTIVRYTAEELDEMIRNGEDNTDWARIDALTDEEIEASIDFEDEGDFSGGEVMPGIPFPRRQQTVELDRDIVDFLKDQGKEYQTRINAVLRSYIDAQKRSA